MRNAWLARLLPYGLLAVIAVPLGLTLHAEIEAAAQGQSVRWIHPGALLLLGGPVLIAWVAFHLRRMRAPTLAFSRVPALRGLRRGVVSWMTALPDVLRVIAVALLAVALARPQTFRTEAIEIEGIDIMLILDLSKSMEERDIKPNRLDAGKTTIREFLTSRETDRVGMVVFAQAAMLQCPLTLDYGALDQIVADLDIGDVPEMGTAIGDSLALALASLRRSDSRSRVVILLSDGDSNFTTQFSPREAKAVAVDMNVKVFTILLGEEENSRSLFGSRYSINPELLREIARDTGGMFFRAGDDRQLRDSFDRVRDTLEKTRRKVTGRVPGAELFSWLVIPAFILLLLELLLRITRWRRFP